MDNEELYGNDVTTILERSFYSDDMLKGFPTTEEAITIIQQVKDLCLNGGFNLRKFISNNTTVLKSIPDDSRRTAVKDEKLALGCQMEYRERYTWVYNKTCGKPSTRRGLLSMLSNIYDPLWVGSPIYVKRKTNHSAIVPREIVMK